MKTLKILFATPECAPWVKTGGLGEVSADLPKALRAQGLDAQVLMPAYDSVLKAAHAAGEVVPVADLPAAHGLPAARLLRTHLPSDVPALLVDAPALYRRDGGPYGDPSGRDHEDNAIRFGLLSHVAARLASQASPLPWQPDVLHCNDWPTALAPAYLAHGLQGRAATVMGLHNMAFQGLFPLHLAGVLGLPDHLLHMEGVEFWGQLSFLKAGIQYADHIATVSPTYAREILSEPLGCGLSGVLANRREALSGILNGIDTGVWNPGTDAHLHQTYDAATLANKRYNKLALQRRMGLREDPDAFVMGMVSRMTDQKGVDLVIAALPQLLGDGTQVVALGTGTPAMETAWREAAHVWPEKAASFIGFDESLAHLIEAGSDVFLMPSRFEPCGLNQMYSQRYGTPPIVHATGGLADAVLDAASGPGQPSVSTGFKMGEPTVEALLHAVRRARELYADKDAWSVVCRNGMAQDFSWESSAAAYADLYAGLVARRAV
jgi:starch synthase